MSTKNRKEKKIEFIYHFLKLVGLMKGGCFGVSHLAKINRRLGGGLLRCFAPRKDKSSVG